MKRKWIMAFVVVALALAGSAGLAGCGATDNGGSGGDGDTDSDTDTDITIYDVRQGNVDTDTVVTLRGVVVTSPTYVKDSGGIVYIEEPEGGPWSGIAMYMWSDVLLEASLAVGDSIDVTGTYTEYYGKSEITVSAATDITANGAGTLPAPALVLPASVIAGAPDAESYESVLVRVEDVAITNADLGYGEFEVTGGLPVDDYFFASGGGPSGANILPADGETFGAIVGILDYTSFNDVPEYKIAPRDLDDYEGYSGTIDTDTDTTPEEVTIHQIQQGEVASGDNVILTGVIVTSPLTFDGSGFFVEEASGGEYSGIFVYNYNGDTDPAQVAVGDVVTITAGFSEFNGCSELTIDASTAVEVTSSGAALPAPVAIADPSTIATGGADAERYEGVLVTVSGVTVTEETGEFGEFVVTGGLMVGSLFFEEFLSPAVDDAYATITGPLHYSYENSKLEPRDAADLVQ